MGLRCRKHTKNLLFLVAKLFVLLLQDLHVLLFNKRRYNYTVKQLIGLTNWNYIISKVKPKAQKKVDKLKENNKIVEIYEVEEPVNCLACYLMNPINYRNVGWQHLKQPFGRNMYYCDNFFHKTEQLLGLKCTVKNLDKNRGRNDSGIQIDLRAYDNLCSMFDRAYTLTTEQKSCFCKCSNPEKFRKDNPAIARAFSTFYNVFACDKRTQILDQVVEKGHCRHCSSVLSEIKSFLDGAYYIDDFEVHGGHCPFDTDFDDFESDDVSWDGATEDGSEYSDW